MSHWIRFNRSDCPVCNGLRKDCRQNTETNLVHCRAVEANPPDWIFRGQDAWGFGLWVYAPDAEAWTEEKREEWRREQKARRQKRERIERERNERSLSAAERDREIEKVLSQLTLSNRHRQQLQNRRLTNQQIEDGGYRSLTQWQKLSSPIDDRLAGIKKGGRSLLNPDSGILCPIFNEEGLLVSWQVRQDNNSENKYLWAASERKRKNRPSSKTKEFNELPLGIWQQPNNKGSNKGIIGLTEGTGIKPHIASCRLNIPVIGASGGNFASSPKTLKAALEKLKPSSIILYPDAGAVCNPNVVRQYQKLFDLLRDWGYESLVAWWGQVQKSDGDIDEVDSVAFPKIEYLSIDEFLELAQKYCKVVEIDRWQKQQEAAKNRTWKQLTSLTAKPWLEVNTPKLEEIGLETKLERGHIYLLKSAKSTGKTKAVKPFVEEFTNIYSWFNRIALGREECHKLGLDYKDDLKSYQGFLKTGFCANSSYQFNPTILKNNGLLLGDESDQLLSYLFESICNKDGIRPAILKAFEAQLKAVIAGNGMALFMSADNSDIEHQFLKQIAPKGCEVRVIVNHYQPPKGKVNFDISDSPEGAIDKLVKNLKNGTPCFVIDDIKNGVKGCKSIAEYVKNLLPDVAGSIVEINSDTSGSEKIKNYLKDINSTSSDTLLLICSPSVISGISIENGHFQQGYGFYNGVLTAKEAAQSLVRVRGLENLTVWAAEKGFTWAGGRSLTPEEIRDYYQRNYASNSKYLSSFDVNYDPLTDEWSSHWFELYCKYAAYRNLSMSDLRLRLREKLVEEGYTIVEISPELQSDTNLKLKESWGNINLERALAIESANILTDDELEKLSNSKKTPPEQQLDIEKTILLKQYGQPLIDRVTHQDKYTGETLAGYAALYLKDNGGSWYKQLKQLYYLIDNYDEAARSDRFQESQQQFYGERFAGDVSWNARKRQCRLHLGVDKLLDSEWRQAQDYEQLANIAKTHYRSIKDTVGLSVKKLTPAQVYTELIRQLGLKTESKQIKQSTPDGKKTIRLKRITPESWELAELFIAHREKLKLQRTTQTSEPNQLKEAVTPSPIFISKERGGVLPSKSYEDNGFQPPKRVEKSSARNIEQMAQNSTTTSDNLIEQNNTEYPLDNNEVEVFDSNEAIADIADMLTKIEDAEGLTELQKVPEFTSDRLNKAVKLLSLEWQQRLREWAMENRQRRSGHDYQSSSLIHSCWWDCLQSTTLDFADESKR